MIRELFVLGRENFVSLRFLRQWLIQNVTREFRSNLCVKRDHDPPFASLLVVPNQCKRVFLWSKLRRGTSGHGKCSKVFRHSDRIRKSEQDVSSDTLARGGTCLNFIMNEWMNEYFVYPRIWRVALYELISPSISQPRPDQNTGNFMPYSLR